MKKRLLALLLLMGICGGVSGKAPSVTPDGGFTLSAGDQSVPSSFGRFLSAGEKLFLEKTGFSQAGFPPVHVILHSSSDNLAKLPALSVDALEGGSPSISLHLKSGDQGIESTRLLVASLLLREYYGEHAPPPGSRVPHYPPWVLDGLATLCFPSDEAIRLPSSYTKGDALPSLEDFLIQRPPDGSQSSLADLYMASASMLLKAGLSTPSGQAAFRKWVGHNDSKQQSTDPAPWVGGWEMKQVEKRWLLLLVGNSGDGDGSVKLQKPLETLKAYETVMQDALPEGSTINSLARDKKSGSYTLGKLSDRLKGIRLRGSPMVTPLIDRTLILVGNAPKLSKKKIEEEEKSLADLQIKIEKQSREIESYMDWFEAMKLPVRSGYFDRLLKTPDSEVRKGPVGRYLDAVEERGW